jgi:hypothetical protein
MKRFVLFIFFAVQCFSANGQVKLDLLNRYNEFFYEGDFEKAVEITSKLVASNPYQLEYLREHLKMLAGNQKKKEFQDGMLALRAMGTPDSLKQFFLVLKSGIVPLEYINELKNYFFKQEDFEILSYWDPNNYKGIKPFKAVLEEIKRAKKVEVIDFNKKEIETPKFNTIFKSTAPPKPLPQENPERSVAPDKKDGQP